MALLAVPGMVTGILLLLYGSQIIVMFHVRQYGTLEMASRILALTALALGSSSIAWYTAIRRPLKTTSRFRIPFESSNMRFWIYALLAVVAGTLTAKALGPYVWTASYATESTELFLRIGTTPAVAATGIIGMYTMLLSGAAPKNYRPFFWLIALYTLGDCMLFRGMRLEVFAVGLAMYAGYLMKTGTGVRPFRLLSIMVIVYLFAQTVGVLRSITDAGITAREGLVMAFRFVYEEGLEFYFQLGTFADIAGTFYNAVGLIDDRIVKPLLGLSYLSYIPRTFPEFLYPGRPRDLALIFENYGLTTGGGMFELAEAYINFGVAGCVIVPAIITYLIARVSRNAEADSGFTGLMLYLLVFSLFLRGTWYQTFAFYKTMVAWVVLEFFIWLTIRFFDDFIFIRNFPVPDLPAEGPSNGAGSGQSSHPAADREP